MLCTISLFISIHNFAALHTGITFTDKTIDNIIGKDAIEDFLETKTCRIIYAYAEKPTTLIFSTKVIRKGNNT